MEWLKIKHLFVSRGEYEWMFSHAANPVPFILNNDKELVRIFFTSRTIQNISHIGYIDIDFSDNNLPIINIAKKPVVIPGPLGAFDDSGTAMGYIIEKNKEIFLFYLGWNLKVTVPWLNSIGLTTADSIDGPYKKYSLAPIMDRSAEDPYSISYPSIIFDEGIYKMWYGSNLSWGKDQNEMRHVIKYAESKDLIRWYRLNETHISLEHPNEYALSKPWVIKENNIFHMWYSYRGNGNIDSYRIGYAKSSDGKKWKRFDDKVGIDVSKSGWDSEMICYPSVFSLNSRTFMLYNGNAYGKTGFGVAILKNDQ